MGILNVTPDSFSDGGRFLEPAAALEQAARMVEEGAALIDVGGASSRPRGTTYGEGAPPVTPEEELRRVLPVVCGIVDRLPDTLVSVDTVHPTVARAVLEEGAHMINDITGLRHAPELAGLVAEFGAGLVLMHSVGQVGQLSQTSSYEDVLEKVASFLAQSASTARKAGVESVILDPGFGFGKSPEDNFRLLRGTEVLLALGYPVMVAVSRKSSIGVLLGSKDRPVPVEERLYGSLGAAAGAVARGASVVRAHDVGATWQMLRGLQITLDSAV